MRLVAAVFALNALFTAVGYALVLPLLRERRALHVASWAGVALLTGAATVGVALSLAAIAGLQPGPATVAGAALVVAALGWTLARRLPPPALPEGRPPGLLGGAAAGALSGLLALVVVGGFRSSPWLDDTWFFWLPKGVVLERLGLDARLWEGSDGFLGLTSPDYPLWWSVVAALDVSAAGLDLRAVNGQLALLLTAFVGALARLLWGWVRPGLLWPSLLLATATPELVRQAQGGGADVPLAIYLVLFALGACGWLARGEPAGLALAGVAAAAALAIKVEGLPQVALLAVALSVVFRRRLRLFWLALGGAFATSLPWLAWTSTHGLENEISLRAALDPGYLLDRTERVRPAFDGLVRHALSPREWLVVVPLAFAVALLASTGRRRWLALPALALAQLAFWVWVYWADPNTIEYRVGTSSYRVVVPIVLLLAVAIPLAGEDAVKARRARSARPRTPA